MKIEGDGYAIEHAEGTTSFSGSLRLNGTAEYQPIADFLDESLEAGGDAVQWDLSRLEFLNSSGINMLYKFVIGLRKRGNVTMKVRGSSEIAWQAKSLANMKKFLPGLELEIA
ncbi:MAG: hypothetical protein AAGE01_04030 [Pseudomonadota bacterium]